MICAIAVLVCEKHQTRERKLQKKFALSCLYIGEEKLYRLLAEQKLLFRI